MENIRDDCNNYWENILIQNEETNTLFPNEELDSWGFDEAVSSYYDSSSPDGPPSSSLSPSKNIVSERNRRRKLNERLFALRAVVPNISKMDKASIIKDAIEYIQELHDQERRVQTEISELETGKMMMKNDAFDSDQGMMGLARLKKKRIGQCYDTGGTRASPVEVLELNVSSMGERTLVVSLTCSKKTDTMVKLCEAFESLKLKIITANITALSGRLLKTVFIEANEEEKELLRKQIINAITALSEPESPMSI